MDLPDLAVKTIMNHHESWSYEDHEMPMRSNDILKQRWLNHGIVQRPQGSHVDPVESCQRLDQLGAAEQYWIVNSGAWPWRGLEALRLGPEAISA